MSQFEKRINEALELKEPYEIVWSYEQFSYTVIRIIRISTVQYDFEKGGNIPVIVAGEIEIENKARLKTIPFKYYHDVISLDLKGFPYTKEQAEILRLRLKELAQTAGIRIGKYYRYITESKFLLTNFLWFLAGAILVGAWLRVIWSMNN
jgi:hypothetical protein